MNEINYLSTRGLESNLSFEDVLLSGLARDGGLYLPDTWPSFSNLELNEMKDLDYISLAEKIISPFVGKEIGSKIYGICKDVYGNFDHKDVVPIKKLDGNLYVMELFYGPTFAFKDYAMQFLAHVFDYVLKQKKKKILIVGATSGDTGSAALEAFKKNTNVDLFILFPNNKISSIQQKQMTTIFKKGCQSLAIKTDFDGCQSIVKSMFTDLNFKDEVKLSAINSINWARLIPQVVYYFYGAFKLGAPNNKVNFSVPTGNFGNIFAGWVAKKMGLPIDKLICASNQNDILTRFFYSGTMERKSVQQSYSPSMDIQVSSNFERLLFEMIGRDSEALNFYMEQFEKNKKFNIDKLMLKKFNDEFVSFKVSNFEIIDEIKNTYNKSKYLLDPHSAVGIRAAKSAISDSRIDNKIPLISLACAHPAKFPNVIEKSLNFFPENPPALEIILKKEENFKILNNEIYAIKSYIKNNMR
tara:strand:- start:77 stop:1486 length:1410 start_codon:yes stop_codon:yes gene_type:complete